MTESALTESTLFEEELVAEAAGGFAPAAAAMGKMSLRQRAIRGSFWTMLAYGSSQVLRFGSNMLLTRLLFPQVFGLMAMVSVFIQGLHMFSDMGIAPSIIQNPKGDDPKFLNTAWTIQAARGVCLWICSILLAFPISRLYGHPEFRLLIPAAAFSAVLDGLVSTNLFSLGRHLALGWTTAIDLGTQIFAIVVMVVWARFSPTVWALIAGSLASNLAKTILTHFLPGVRNHFCWDRESRIALMKFGRWVFVSTVLTFLSSQTDRLVFGMKIPLASLGVYSIAATLAGIPTQAVIKIAGPITLSLYSRLAYQQSNLTAAFNRVRFPLLVCAGWGIGCLIVVGPLMIHVLYDNRYSDAAWIIQFLVISAWFEIMETTNGSALLAIGVPRWVAAANGAKLIALAILIPLGFHTHGFPGALAGLVGSECCRYGMSAIAIGREHGGVVWRDMLLTAMLAVSVGLACLVDHFVHQATTIRFIPAACAAMVVTLFWAIPAYQAFLSLRGDSSPAPLEAPALAAA